MSTWYSIKLMFVKENYLYWIPVAVYFLIMKCQYNLMLIQYVQLYNKFLLNLCKYDNPKISTCLIFYCHGRKYLKYLNLQWNFLLRWTVWQKRRKIFRNSLMSFRGNWMRWKEPVVTFSSTPISKLSLHCWQWIRTF